MKVVVGQKKRTGRWSFYGTRRWGNVETYTMRETTLTGRREGMDRLKNKKGLLRGRGKLT